jgi:hypothetical protein
MIVMLDTSEIAGSLLGDLRPGCGVAFELATRLMGRMGAQRLAVRFPSDATP